MNFGGMAIGINRINDLCTIDAQSPTGLDSRWAKADWKHSAMASSPSSSPSWCWNCTCRAAQTGRRWHRCCRCSWPTCSASSTSASIGTTTTTCCTRPRWSTAACWANLNLLFWLSLIPFATGWMGQNHFAPLPVALYGAMLFLSAVAYMILERALFSRHPANSPLARAVGKDGKGLLSALLYLLGIPLAYFNTWAALAVYVLVAALWFLPDRRIEAHFKN